MPLQKQAPKRKPVASSSSYGEDVVVGRKLPDGEEELTEEAKKLSLQTAQPEREAFDENTDYGLRSPAKFAKPAGQILRSSGGLTETATDSLGDVDFVQTPLSADSSFFPSPIATSSTDISLADTATPLTPGYSPTSPRLIHANTNGSAISASSTASTDSKWRAALSTGVNNTTHFLGGLIHHPYEHNRHYTILRHSHGIVYYRGPATSLAITIFSDKPLPADRRVFLQNKGWTGRKGQKLKALVRANWNWIDVTPRTKITSSQAGEPNERAWQRDITKFLNSSKRPKETRKHTPRETHIVRIPHGAEDGYFRLVLTSGTNRGTLCSSPVFRVASTSTAPSSIKGASLMTFPLEMGMYVGSKVANSMAMNALQPATSALSAVAAPVQQYEGYAQTAYDVGIAGKVAAMNETYDETLQRRLIDGDGAKNVEGEYLPVDRPDIVGSDAGPKDPCPIKLESKIVKGTGRSTEDLGIPTANLAASPLDLKVRLSGVYIGWCSLVLPKALVTEGDRVVEWTPSVITVAKCPYRDPGVADLDVIKTYLVSQMLPSNFIGSKITVLVVAPLRPAWSHLVENFTANLEETYRDISIASESLERENWSAEKALESLRTRMKERSMSDRFVDVRQVADRNIDKVPLHWVGVRQPAAAIRDGLIDKGGLWIERG